MINWLKACMGGGKSARRLAWAVAVAALLFGPSALPASAATSIVQMVNFSFQPPSLTNNVGDTVRWSNTTVTAHNVVSSNSVWTPVTPFTNPATFQVTFSAAGTTSDLVNVTVVTAGPIRFDTNLALVGGSLPLRLSVTPGLSYAIESSTDLTAWQPYTNFVATDSTMNFASPTTGVNGHWFRARLSSNP